MWAYYLHCWCFIQFLHFRTHHRNMSVTFLVFFIDPLPHVHSFLHKGNLDPLCITCFSLVCHFLPKVIESSHIQNEYAHRFGTLLTKRPIWKWHNNHLCCHLTSNPFLEGPKVVVTILGLVVIDNSSS